MAYQLRVKEMRELKFSINKIEQIMYAVTLYGFTLKIQSLHEQVNEKKMKTILIDKATISVNGRRIEKKYKRLFLPIYLGSFREFNFKTKTYILKTPRPDQLNPLDYIYRYRNRSNIRFKYISDSMEKFIKKQEYMIYDVDDDPDATDTDMEVIDRYRYALKEIIRYKSYLEDHINEISSVIDLKKKNY
jgi:hypothetical protein